MSKQKDDLLLFGEISAEVAISEVPLSPEARQAADKLVSEDTDPCWVAVEIEEGKGGHGNYKGSAIQALVNQVGQKMPMGYAGHQEPNKLPYEFPTPTTHWLAAELVDRGGKAVARVYGLIDKAAGELKRWVRTRRINQVSLYGKISYAKGTKDVVDLDLYSLDWTPRNRAGMTTRLVWASEIDDGGGERVMAWRENCIALKNQLQSGEVSAQQICGEMGWTAEQLVKILDPEWANKVTGEMAVMGEIRKTVTGEKPAEVIAQTFETLGKVKSALGVAGEMDVVAVATEAAKAVVAQKKAALDSMVTEVLKEKVADEMAQALVMKMVNIPEDATKEQVAGEIDRVLADETVKDALSKLFVDKPPFTGGSSGGNTNTGILRKRISSI